MKNKQDDKRKMKSFAPMDLNSKRHILKIVKLAIYINFNIPKFEARRAYKSSTQFIRQII